MALLIGTAAVRLLWPMSAEDAGREPPPLPAGLRPAAPAIALPAAPRWPTAGEDSATEVPADSRTAAEPLSLPATAPSPVGKPATPPRPRPSPGPSAAAAETTTVTPAAPREEPPPPAPAPAVPAAPPASADERCADRANFITRDLCRIQACRDPALVADPVCVRFRAMEQANRNRGAD